MKIISIGPTYPYRGGISHYNTLLCKHLSKNHKVKCISFKKLYSKLLIKLFYKTNIDFKDKESKELIKFDAKEIIDTTNPLTWLNTFFEIKKQEPDMLIFHWQTPYFSLVYFSIMFLIRLFTKTKILLICHNVLPHEARFIDKLLTKLVFLNVNYFIVHSKDDFTKLKILKKNTNAKLGFHPIYDMFNTKKFDIKKIRKELELKNKVILFFGFIREYKGLKYLIKSLPRILKKINLDLLIVGEFWEKEEYVNLIQKLNLQKNIKIVDKYVPNEEVGKYFNIADVVVLPYESATQSGVVQVAYGFNKPVITTDVGGLKDSVLNNKTGFIIKPKDSIELAEAIIKFYKQKKEKGFIKNIKKEKDKFSWDNYIYLIKSFLK